VATAIAGARPPAGRGAHRERQAGVQQRDTEHAGAGAQQAAQRHAVQCPERRAHGHQRDGQHRHQDHQQRDHREVALDGDPVAGHRVGEQRLQRPGVLAAADRLRPGADPKHQHHQRRERGEQAGMQVPGRGGERNAPLIPDHRLEAFGEVGEHLVEGRLAPDRRVQRDREQHQPDQPTDPPQRRAAPVPEQPGGDDHARCSC
jgi:hypothetical protein